MRTWTLCFLCSVAAIGCGEPMEPADGGTDSGPPGNDAGTDAGPECVADNDCAAPADECMEAMCVAGECTETMLAAGTRTRMQVVGDCLMRECDAAGEVVEVDFNPDAEDDSNPCTMDTCLDGEPQHTPTNEGGECGVDLMCDAVGRCVGCTAPAQCPGADEECSVRACDAAGMCGRTPTDRGVALASQTDGDCRVNQCNGSGGTETVDDDADVPEDLNDCTTDFCTSATPSMPDHTDVDADTPCQGGQGLCDGAGMCVVDCTSPSDCPDAIEPDCGTPTCMAGTCGLTLLDPGTVVATQVPNDCHTLLCTAGGGSMMVVEDTDAPADDGNPCTGETCSAGTPQHPPLDPFTACGAAGQVCTGRGMCVDSPESGDFYVVRVGTGAAALTDAATEVFLERHAWDGALESTIALPAANGAADRFTADGNSTSESGLSRSADARFLVLAGYRADVGTITVEGTAAAAPRVIARIDASGNVDTTTTLTNAFLGNNARGATSFDGTAFWVSGQGTSTTNGIHHVLFGSTGASTRLYMPNASSGCTMGCNVNTRNVHVFGDRVYATTQASSNGSVIGVFTMTDALPTTSGQNTTTLTGMGVDNTAEPVSFALFDLSAAVAGVDTAYVADQRVPPAGGIQRWRSDGATWTLETTFAGATGYRGLTGVQLGSVVLLYAVTPDFRVVRFLDDGTPSAEVMIATAPTNTGYRGVALAPR